MVFFTCNNCGTCLKKNQVEWHMSSCGKVVSCMDCQKEFRGNDFQSHTKCISEAEKYNGPDWKPPSSHNKGERKQMAWVETVNSVLENNKQDMTPSQFSLLKTIAKHDNVPRKKPKFLNFVSNVTKNAFAADIINLVWDNLEAEWKRQAELNKAAVVAANGAGKSDGANTNGNTVKNNPQLNDTQNSDNAEVKTENECKKKKKKNKRKREDVDEEDEDANCQKKQKDVAEELPETENENGESLAPDSTPDFKWGEIIKQIILTREEKSISLKKLKKKVFSEYYARVGDAKGVKTKEDLAIQLKKKLKKKKFKVVGELVQLVEVD